MTPLEKIIRGMIDLDGPMPIDRYMSLCLGHAEHGYYMTRDPFGTKGDFTTAPEISQIFGELIGVWVAQAWEALRRPRHFALVEFGPGRGTLMADVVRVLQKIPACAKALEVHFVETSPVLRNAQRQRFPDATWHGSAASLPTLPNIVLANEFFDALPIRQFERRGMQLFERVVGVEKTGLQIGLVASSFLSGLTGDGVFEDSSIRQGVALQLADHLSKVSGAALIIDYGHATSGMGDTLQAMHAHRFCAITDAPGQVDLTSHVDFEALARAFERGGAKVVGPMTQGDFLRAMGLEQRTLRLSAGLETAKQRDIVSASERLANPDQMGELFKVMAVTCGLDEPLYPFGQA